MAPLGLDDKFLPCGLNSALLDRCCGFQPTPPQMAGPSLCLLDCGIDLHRFVAGRPGGSARPANFPVHMLGHLLLGMLGPLLIAFSAPMALLLRSIPVPFARRISRLLRSKPVHFIAHPLVAALLNIGGLWILYASGLFIAMHHSFILHLAVHFHVFATGFLFTVSLIYVDVVPYRRSFRIRAFILIIAMAGHGILSKYLYAHPPDGVPSEQAKLGGMLMYYGGDAVDLILVLWLCMQWYKSSRPRSAASLQPISD